MSERKYSRDGRTLLIVLVAVLAVAAGVCVWLWTSTPPRPSVGEGKSVADAFLASLRAGKPDDAWQATTADFKSFEGKETFRKRAAKTPQFKQPMDFISVQTVTVGTLPRDEYLYRSKEGRTARILVADENGAWKVDRVTTD
jgi:hypothetical protein